jgi:hypothetical protein
VPSAPNPEIEQAQTGEVRVTLIGRLLALAREVLERVLERLRPGLNLSWITDNLAAGGAIPSAALPRLRKMGFTAVVDCRVEECDDRDILQANGIEFLQLPTPDNHQLTQAALDEGVAWVQERIARGGKVFVHCMHGIGRGPLLGCCVLVAQGRAPLEALTTMKTRRWQTSPNQEQLDALLEFAVRRRASSTADTRS